MKVRLEERYGTNNLDEILITIDERISTLRDGLDENTRNFGRHFLSLDPANDYASNLACATANNVEQTTNPLAQETRYAVVKYWMDDSIYSLEVNSSPKMKNIQILCVNDNIKEAHNVLWEYCRDDQTSNHLLIKLNHDWGDKGNFLKGIVTSYARSKFAIFAVVKINDTM